MTGVIISSLVFAVATVGRSRQTGLDGRRLADWPDERSPALPCWTIQESHNHKAYVSSRQNFKGSGRLLHGAVARRFALDSLAQLRRRLQKGEVIAGAGIIWLCWNREVKSGRKQFIRIAAAS